MAVAPLTLYLDLEPGETADLEIVASASIAWSRAIKEMAYILDPGAEVRVELQSGTEGSLGLNTLIRMIKGVDRKTLTGIVFGLSLWIGKETVAWVYQNMLDDVTGQHQQLSEEDFARIVDAVERGAAREQVQRVYREVERDPSIRGVGVALVPGVRPAHIVPRSEFRKLAGYGLPQIEDVRRRTTPDHIEAILIKPVLVVGSRRRWRFQVGEQELAFIMDDHEFVDGVLRGHRPLGMLAGIIFSMEVAVTEELKDGVWTISERHITRVVGIRAPDTTISMTLSRQDDDPDNDDQ